ncbi:MAG: ispF [Clostridia bacterium]|jgi:2-C-methyl-D-erythritol 2,4-cyclodiphosphate synthase|nr:ispF [Clostridia bacterium]
MRIGWGYDVHRLTENRLLILGGIQIPFEKGLLGHSDADVLIHAIIDALLGAAGLGDIGRNFPDTDNSYKDIDSAILLKRTLLLLKEKKFEIENIDSTIVAQAPKLLPYIEKMRNKLSLILEIEPEKINIKAKTEEGLGFTGKSEGIAAQAVCLLY